MQRKRIFVLFISHCLVAAAAVILWNAASIVETARRVTPPTNVSYPDLYGATKPFVGPITTTNDDLDSVIRALEAGEVERAYIVSATGISTEIRATPEACVGFAPNRIDYQLNAKRSLRLASLLREIRVNSVEDARGADVRVGLILWGRRTRSSWRWGVFTDEFGKRGYVGVHSVKTNAALVTFVNRVLSGVE